MGWTEKALEEERKSAHGRMIAAGNDDDDAGMDHAWLRTGTKTHLSHLLYWCKRGKKK
jgi:hypothetical protein